MSDACVEQTAKAVPSPVEHNQSGPGTLAEWQKNSPVNIISWMVGVNKDNNLVVKRVVIENLGIALVVEYQLGWMLIFADKEPEVHVLDPVAVGKMESKATMEIGEPLPVDSTQDDEFVVAKREEAYNNSATHAVPPITLAPGLRVINLFIASVKREGSPDFHENVNKLLNQVKTRFGPVKATAD